MTRDDRRQSIVVLDPLSQDGLALLRAEPDVDVHERTGLPPGALAGAVEEAHAIVVRSGVRISRDVIEAAPRLRVIGRAGTGVDNIDVEAATERGVLVMNVPDATANTTAEHTLAMIMALARRIPAADRSVRAGAWDRAKFVGTELDGKVLGILGGGNIGRRVARKAQALGMEPIVHDPFLAPDALRDIRVSVLPLDVVLAKADILTLHVPLMESTRHMVDAGFLGRTRPGVWIIQCARGGIVVEADLVDAIASGRVGGAALDVFEREPPPADHPLFALDNVVLTPHLGASTGEAQARASVQIARQILRYLRAGEVENAVNLPSVPAGVMRRLAPWVDLGRRLGAALAGLGGGACDRVVCSYHGGLAREETTPVTRAVLAGLLGPALGRPVNLVNAMALAESRGIAVEERRSERVRDFASMLTVRSGGAAGASVAGTLFGHRQPRLIKIGEFHLEAIVEGTLLILRNDDRPGVVGRVGSLLGAEGINIRAMHLSPPRGRERHAIAVLNISEPLSEKQMESVRELEGIESATLIRLD